MSRALRISPELALPLETVTRFWRRVEKGDGCWLFNGCRRNKLGHLRASEELFS